MKRKTLLTAFLTLFLLAFYLPAIAEKDDIITLITEPSTLVYPSFWHTPFGIHRGTPFWLKVFLGNRTVFANPQDVACTKMLNEYGKIKEGDDWQLTAFGVNSDRGEIIYNPSMHALAVFGSHGSGQGQFKNPVGIACNEYGDVYVADTGNHRIVRLYYDDRKLKFLRTIGMRGIGVAMFDSPRYVEMDSYGRVYVSDTGNNRIQVFSKSGGFLYEIGSADGISNPQGLCVTDDGARYAGYRENRIFVVDGNGNRIQKFDFEGRLIASVRADEATGMPVKLTAIDHDYFGNVYAVDNLNSRILKFTPDLKFITEYGSFGTNDYQFEKPTGIAIYRHYGQVIVSDRESAQYFWIGADIKNIRAKRKTGENAVIFDFFLTEKAFVSITLEKNDSKLVVCKDVQFETGSNSITWQVPEAASDLFIKEGENYAVVFHVMSTYSSYPHIRKEARTELYF